MKYGTMRGGGGNEANSRMDFLVCPCPTIIQRTTVTYALLAWCLKTLAASRAQKLTGTYKWFHHLGFSYRIVKLV
jgi:hypothetical protein